MLVFFMVWLAAVIGLLFFEGIYLLKDYISEDLLDNDRSFDAAARDIR